MPRTLRAVLIEREHKVWQLRQKCWTQQRIADELGITQAAVSKILKRMSDRFLAQHTDMVGRQKAQQTIQLEYIADEAMQAWERSKEAAKAVTQRAKESEDGSGSSDKQVTTQVKDQDGNPTYLAQAMAALDRLRKLWGTDAPFKVAPTDPKGEREYAGLSDDERIARITALLDKARERRDRRSAKGRR